MNPHAIKKLISDSSDFCHICVKKCVGIPLELQDKIYLPETKDVTEGLQYDDVFCLLLGEETMDKLSYFETICSTCAHEALKCYKFILKTKQNVDNIIQSIENLYNIINNLNVNKDNCKSIFIDLKSNKYLFDTKPFNNNKNQAIKRFISIKNQNPAKNEDFKDLKLLIDDTKLFKCQKCLELFSNENTLQTHSKFCVVVLNTHQCKECTQLFETEDLLEKHNMLYHSKTICTTCGKLYQSTEALEQHKALHSQNLMCHSCGKVYRTNISFKNHINLNMCNRPTQGPPRRGTFICDYCSKGYTQKMSLRVHIQYEHLNYKAHKCKFCNKKFWARSRLKYHMVKHTKEKKFACTSCGGKFVTKESLLYHTRIHTGEKPYDCIQCGEQFLSASRRQVHYKKVHLQETFPCSECNMMFPSKYKRTKHMQSKHF